MADDEARAGQKRWIRGVGGALSAFVVEIGIVVALLGVALALAAMALLVF